MPTCPVDQGEPYYKIHFNNPLQNHSQSSANTSQGFEI